MIDSICLFINFNKLVSGSYTEICLIAECKVGFWRLLAYYTECILTEAYYVDPEKKLT